MRQILCSTLCTLSEWIKPASLFFFILYSLCAGSVRNVCDKWLDYVPIAFACTVTSDLNHIYNYHCTLTTDHIDGGFGLWFPEPNTYITFKRFGWEIIDKHPVVNILEMSVWLIEEPNGSQDYILEMENDTVSFADPVGRGTEIQFHPITWRRVNLFMYAQVASGNKLLKDHNVTVLFNESLEKTSAENISNYFINPKIAIKSAILQADKRTVILDTSKHQENIEYTLIVNGVEDLAGNATDGETKKYVKGEYVYPETSALFAELSE